VKKIIAFIAFESPWFPAGGIAAVLGRLPGATEAAAGLPTVVITPFHLRSEKIAALEMDDLGDFELPYDTGAVRVTVFYHHEPCAWYFLKPGQPSAWHSSVFAGTQHPYDRPKDGLLRDALFFGAAAVRALPIIAKHLKAVPESVEWHLFAQDWEGATALLAFASQVDVRGKCHLTLHNSYDASAPPAELSRVGIDPGCCPGDTILNRSSPGKKGAFSHNPWILHCFLFFPRDA